MNWNKEDELQLCKYLSHISHRLNLGGVLIVESSQNIVTGNINLHIVFGKFHEDWDSVWDKIKMLRNIWFPSGWLHRFIKYEHGKLTLRISDKYVDGRSELSDMIFIKSGSYSGVDYYLKAKKFVQEIKTRLKKQCSNWT